MAITVHHQCPPCPLCGKHEQINLPFENFCSWVSGGVSLELAFPWLSPEEQELLHSGTHEKCAAGI